MMLNGLLGVDFEDCLQDYLLSNFSSIGGQRYPHKASDRDGDDAAKYIDAIRELPGETFQEKVYLALRMIGCPAAQLDKIIDIMTIGNKAVIPESAKIGADSELVSTASKTTTSDFLSPASYYAVPANGSVSFTTNTTAGNKDVIVYLGYTGNIASPNDDGTNDTNPLLSSAITLKIDNVEQTIGSTRTLWTAGFGTTQNTGRLGYMFNILGNYNFTAGQHKVEIGVKNGTFNIATIGVVDR